MEEFPDPWMTHDFIPHINEAVIGGEESLKTENLGPYQEVRGARLTITLVFFFFRLPKIPLMTSRLPPRSLTLRSVLKS